MPASKKTAKTKKAAAKKPAKKPAVKTKAKAQAKAKSKKLKATQAKKGAPASQAAPKKSKLIAATQKKASQVLKAAAGAVSKKLTEVAAQVAPTSEAPVLRKKGRAKKKVEEVKSAEQQRFEAIVARTTVSRTAIGEVVCRETACENLGTLMGYCRLHYIKNWKKIQQKKTILDEKKLNRYIEELVSKYPERYIEVIRQDLSTSRDFAKVIIDLELDESSEDFDGEGESMDDLIDNIKRDFDSEDEAF